MNSIITKQMLLSYIKNGISISTTKKITKKNLLNDIRDIETIINEQIKKNISDTFYMIF